MSDVSIPPRTIAEVIGLRREAHRATDAGDELRRDLQKQSRSASLNAVAAAIKAYVARLYNLALADLDELASIRGPHLESADGWQDYGQARSAARLLPSPYRPQVPVQVWLVIRVPGVKPEPVKEPALVSQSWHYAHATGEAIDPELLEDYRPEAAKLGPLVPVAIPDAAEHIYYTHVDAWSVAGTTAEYRDLTLALYAASELAARRPAPRSDMG